MIKVARGMRASYKNYEVVSAEKTLELLELRTDCHEVLNDVNRVYGDVDGKIPDCKETEFWEKDAKTRERIEYILGQQNYCLLTASSYPHRKISWRFVIIDKVVSKKHNKYIIQELIKDAEFPDGVEFDTGVYGENRKMRMLNSNKDNENRPLRLIKGMPIDTLISYIPEGVNVEAEPAEEKKPVGRPRKVVRNPLLVNLLEQTATHRIEHYEDWIEIGIMCFNQGVDVSVWDECSQRGKNYTAGECEKKWRTFTKGPLGLRHLWDWLKQDNPTAYERMKQDDYSFCKAEFETNHFKLMNPPRYVRVEDDGFLAMLTDADLVHNYRNKFCGEDGFIQLWRCDPTIRKYDKLVFCPKQEPPLNCYNIFTGFTIEPAEGDWSAINELVFDLSGRNQAIYEYILNWSAHLIQKPFDKSGIMLIFASIAEGVGKDTYGDYVLGRLIGPSHYMSTTDHENEFFGRFTGHLQNKLLVKLEEMNGDVMTRNDDKLKGWITCERKSYEEKGVSKAPPINSFLRLIGTTNESCPVKLSKTFRRYMLVNPYEGHANDKPYWEQMYARLTPECVAAFHHYLLSRDIETWNPRNTLDTDAVNNAREAQAPPHSRYFQNKVMCNDNQEESFETFFKELKDAVNLNAKFPYQDYKLIQELKKYPHTRRVLHGRTLYKFNFAELETFLKQQHWWIHDM